MNEMNMTSNQPYLLRAMYEWIADNGLTPYVLVDAEVPQCSIPPHVIKDGKVVLNIAMDAVRELELGNEWISFRARFSGVSHLISFPISAVRAIYAQENSQGMAFAGEPALADDTPSDAATPRVEKGRPAGPKPVASDTKPSRKSGKTTSGKSDKPHLRVVK